MERTGGQPHTGSDTVASSPGADWLRATIDLAPIGIAHVGLDGRFLLVNVHLCSTLACTRDDLLARTLQQITHQDDVAHCMALNQQLALGKIRSYRQAIRLMRADGSHARRRLTMSAMAHGNGDPVFFVAIIEDVAEHRAKEAEEQLGYLAVVAHDLRHPLNAIALSAAAMMKILPPDDEPTRQLAIMRRSAMSMDRLIRDLLDVTRIEAGTFAIRPTRFHLAALLDETCEQFEVAAREHEITLSRDVAPDVPMVVGDRDRLGQVLSNLVSNALKFTPPQGRVSVRAYVRHDNIHVSVQDTGPGVHPDSLPHKGIVEAHGGSIWAESELGRGTTFHFTVPVRRR